MNSTTQHNETVVVGLFADQVSAEAAVAALKQRGVLDDRIGVVIADPGTYDLVYDHLPDELKGMAKAPR